MTGFWGSGNVEAGELKKRIQKHEWWVSPQFIRAPHEKGDSDVYFVLGGDINAVIDEAKQELMPIIDEWFSLIVTDYEDPEGTTQQYQQFKKWFGDTK